MRFFWQFMNSQKLAAKAQKPLLKGLRALGIDAPGAGERLSELAGKIRPIPGAIVIISHKRSLMSFLEALALTLNLCACLVQMAKTM